MSGQVLCHMKIVTVGALKLHIPCLQKGPELQIISIQRCKSLPLIKSTRFIVLTHTTYPLVEPLIKPLPTTHLGARLVQEFYHHGSFKHRLAGRVPQARRRRRRL